LLKKFQKGGIYMGQMNQYVNIKTIKTNADGKVNVELEFIMSNIEDKANMLRLFLMQGSVVNASFDVIDVAPQIHTQPSGKVEVSFINSR
jgi:hypothetical protein